MDRADEVHVQVLFSTLMEPEAPNTGRAVTSIASDEAPGPGPEEGSVGDELQPPDERTTASASVKPWSKRIGLPDYSRDYSGLTISSSAASVASPLQRGVRRPSGGLRRRADSSIPFPAGLDTKRQQASTPDAHGRATETGEPRSRREPTGAEKEPELLAVGQRPGNECLGSSGKQATNEEAETEHGVTVRARVHDFLLYDTDNVLMNLVRKVASLPMGLLETDWLLAVWALCHTASLDSREAEYSSRLTISSSAASRKAGRNEMTAPE